MKKNEHLIWHTKSDDLISDNGIFRLRRAKRKISKANGSIGEQSVVYLDAPDWAHVVALTRNTNDQNCFVLVRQYRHGNQGLTLEFPGGQVNPGELPMDAAIREFQEETGYISGNVKEIGRTCPNPAFMNNTMYTFLAEGQLGDRMGQQLDEHEYADVVLVPCQEVLEGRCPEFSHHALMLSALFWYSKYVKGSTGE